MCYLPATHSSGVNWLAKGAFLLRTRPILWAFDYEMIISKPYKSVEEVELIFCDRVTRIFPGTTYYVQNEWSHTPFSEQNSKFNIYRHIFGVTILQMKKTEFWEIGPYTFILIHHLVFVYWNYVADFKQTWCEEPLDQSLIYRYI